MDLQALVAPTVVYLGHLRTRPSCEDQTRGVCLPQNYMAGRDQWALPVPHLRSIALRQPGDCQPDSLERRNDHLIIMLGRLCLDRTCG
jgi:hypothetical protein